MLKCMPFGEALLLIDAPQTVPGCTVIPHLAINSASTPRSPAHEVDAGTMLPTFHFHSE